MVSGLRHRVASVVGTLALTAGAVTLVNTPQFQALLLSLPVVGRLNPVTLEGDAFTFTLATVLVVVLAALWPLFKPRPRRILDTVERSLRRVGLAILVLATVSYFDYTYEVPRPTVIGIALLLGLTLPVYQVLIRRRPASGGRAVIVGDDPDAMAAILAATEERVIGYVSPSSGYGAGETFRQVEPAATDGGGERGLDDLRVLGTLSRLDDVLVDNRVDTALLAFTETDRAEFFGALDTCYRHGVTVMVHRDHADTVLTNGGVGDLVEVDLEPWDWQDHVLKRTFDVAFAGVGLLVLSPVVAAIALAIKLEDSGPVLYRQERTAAFGETFSVAKFRSMAPNAEELSGPTLSAEDAGGVDPRVTRVGRILRRTHLDEIPQLWAILVGDMSVVGPRPERPALDRDIETGLENWRRRWFVKPGLTGLAQIHGATGHDPGEKLRYDIEYIRKQSFWFDLKIVVRQIWLVLQDVGSLVRSAD